MHLGLEMRCVSSPCSFPIVPCLLPPSLLIYVNAGFVGELLWYYGCRVVVLPVKLKFVTKIIKKKAKRLTYT